MSVSLEKIDMLMERANISYKEAKDALENHNGDMVEALIALEASNKTAQPKVKGQCNGARPRPQRSENDFFEDIKKFFQKMHKTSFVIGNKAHKVLDIPLTVAMLLVLVTMPVSMFLLILPYFFGYKITILNAEGKRVKFEETFNFGDEKEKQPEEDRRS